MSSRQELHVVLLGKTGAGKSALGNTLLGRDAFRVAGGMSSATAKCQWAETVFSGKDLQVTDTPGLCDTGREEEDILKEIVKSVAVASPGPHILLIVLRSDRRFTDEENEAYHTLKKLFGEDICKHMIIVFTHIDALGSTPDQQRSKYEENLRNCPDTLKQIISETGNRCFGVNNQASPSEKQKQASDLFDMMINLVEEKRWRYYSNKLCSDVASLYEAEVQQRMQQNRSSRATAVREVNQAIVEEKSSVKMFLDKLLKIVGDVVLHVVAEVGMVAAHAAVKYVTKKCILM